MIKVLTWIVSVVAAVALMVLAVANRNIVLLSLDPFPWVVELPLYALLYAAGLVGLLVGAAAQWWIGRRWRREARLRRREVAELRQQLEARKAPAAEERRPAAELLTPTP